MIPAHAEVIRDLDTLTALTPRWWDLWRRVRAASAFQTPAWLLPWWRAFSPGELFVIAVGDRARLIGLAPGYIEAGPLGRRLLPLGISLSDHWDILVDPGHTETALAAIAKAAQAHDKSWEVWELEELPPEASALSLPGLQGWSERVQRQSACPVLKLPASVDDLLSAFPRAKRQNIQLARNRSARRGALLFECAQGEHAAKAFGQLLRLHTARWESRGEPGVLASEQVIGFHREALRLLDQAGLLRFYTLTMDDSVVAAHYGIASRASHCVYMTGFDPGFAFESPGVLLTAYAIEQAVSEGCSEFDFLRGREGYKYEWGAVDRWNLKRSIRKAVSG